MPSCLGVNGEEQVKGQNDTEPASDGVNPGERRSRWGNKGSPYTLLEQQEAKDPVNQYKPGQNYQRTSEGRGEIVRGKGARPPISERYQSIRFIASLPLWSHSFCLVQVLPAG